MMTLEKRTTSGRKELYHSVIDTIGNTPCIELNKLAPSHVRLFVKAEFFNPAGSVKDRLAVNIIEEAERSGELKPGQTVVEATSGNTGIGLAMVCAAKGYPLVVTMADSFSVERRKLMRFFGAKVVLTPRAEKGFGMYRKAKELAEKNGWFLARQFENPANSEIHENTTAREIVSDFSKCGLDYFVSGYGTGGTLTGVARALRREMPDTTIVTGEPTNAPMLSSGVEQLRDEDNSPLESLSTFNPHPVQGWTPDFIPQVLQESIDGGYYDKIVQVTGPESIEMTRRLAREEGILSGISGGASLAIALKVAEEAAPGSIILCMLPDTGERYLSSPLFEDIADDMSGDEIELSRSTPSSQL